MKFNDEAFCPFKFRASGKCNVDSCAWRDVEKGQCILFTIAELLEEVKNNGKINRKNKGIW